MTHGHLDVSEAQGSKGPSQGCVASMQLESKHETVAKLHLCFIFILFFHLCVNWPIECQHDTAFSQNGL